MVSKKIFQQNGRQTHQRGGFRGITGPYKKPFKQLTGGAVVPTPINQIMFNASQIPDNPGYVDFNNPTPPMGGPVVPNANAAITQPKKKNRNKHKNKQPQQQQQNGTPENWNKNKNLHQRHPPQGRALNGRYNVNSVGGRGFGSGRGRRMMPPPGPRGAMMPPPHVFQPPMLPPMPPMGRGPVPPPIGGAPPPFIRRSGRNAPMPVIPPLAAMPPIMPPRMQRGGARLPPPVPYNGAGKIKKPNVKLTKKVNNKGKSTIKTLKNLVNQYPLDKPWVTDAIRAEHQKKVDIEERLKGNKDDELFAQFKTQRDLFVAQYEMAREQHLKKDGNVTKDAKEKESNKQTPEKDGNSKDAIPNAV